MDANTFGKLFRLTTYGESHGPGLGGIVDGCPSGIFLDEFCIQQALDKRKPGSGPASTARREPDTVQLLSGVFEGKTTGTPIAFHIANTDQRSRDYSDIKDVYRPGHADCTFDAKFGFRDYRGGGRSSGRETASRVAGGAIAQQLLDTCDISVTAFTVELGGISARPVDPYGAEAQPYFSPDPEAIGQWDERIRAVKARGDTLGGIVQVQVDNLPAGLGEPVFDKLDARLAYALMGVGAVKGVEIGAGFAAACATGSGNNDPITPDGFIGNNSGGILGGISSGQPLIVRAAVKPIPSISRPQQTITRQSQATEIVVAGRHDISAIPRIVPVLKAMVQLVLADFVLLQRRMGRG